MGYYKLCWINVCSKEELKPVGSWTAFMKDTSRKNTVKCKLGYLPVIPFPPGDNIAKYFLDMMKD